MEGEEEGMQGMEGMEGMEEFEQPVLHGEALLVSRELVVGDGELSDEDVEHPDGDAAGEFLSHRKGEREKEGELTSQTQVGGSE